jgi:hypothetical protein
VLLSRPPKRRARVSEIGRVSHELLDAHMLSVLRAMAEATQERISSARVTKDWRLPLPSVDKFVLRQSVGVAEGRGKAAVAAGMRIGIGIGMGMGTRERQRSAVFNRAVRRISSGTTDDLDRPWSLLNR